MPVPRIITFAFGNTLVKSYTMLPNVPMMIDISSLLLILVSENSPEIRS